MNKKCPLRPRLDLSHPEMAPLAVVPSTGLRLLLEAYHCVRDLSADEWEFAVEIGCLQEAGLTNTFLRWLVHQGYARHGVERTDSGAQRRLFHPIENLGLPQNSCFVLTDAGADFALGGAPPAAVLVHVASRTPRWDETRRELRVGRVVVKRFKQPAANQELILRAFEEEGWPPRIDDPLPPKPEQAPKRRLHSTIGNLNRGQRRGVQVHFAGGGEGQSVCWRLRGVDSETTAKAERV
jgi:hypothetical protein